MITDYDTISPTAEELELLKLLRRFGKVKRVLWLVGQMQDKRFGEPRDTAQVSVSQNGKGWSVQVSKGAYQEF